MQCPRCQQENPRVARFCNSCDAGFGLTCASCRHSNPAGSRFCNACGASLGAPPTPARPRFLSPDSYTPKHLAEKILTSRAALEGERKHVTVLFADLKGSMELLADRDPEEARKILDPVLERMMDAVHRYEGTVNQVMGDGIMALFGAPLAHEDHADRACYAALRMQESVAQYAADVRHAHGMNVQIRELTARLLDLPILFLQLGEQPHIVDREIEVSATPKDGSVEVSVTDTGVGIAPEDQEAIFEEFRQVGTAEKKAEGTGLGLTLCRKFVELHGGRIWVKSELGAGSTFTFTIPVRRGE